MSSDNQFSYKTSFNLTVRDINYGQHMDHLALLNYLHEARVRCLFSIGCSELNVDGQNSGLVVTELNCKYRRECFYGEQIDITIHLEVLSSTRLNFIYLISKANPSVTIANSVITTAFLNTEHKIISIPDNLLKLCMK